MSVAEELAASYSDAISWRKAVVSVVVDYIMVLVLVWTVVVGALWFTVEM